MGGGVLDEAPGDDTSSRDELEGAGGAGMGRALLALDNPSGQEGGPGFSGA